MNKKEEFNYYDEFAKNTRCSLRCAQMLYEVLEKFDAKLLPDNLKKMHKIENEADQGKHVVTNYLIKDFLPPIERDDIMDLLQKIDDVTDFVEDILINLEIFNVTKLKPVTIELAKLLVDCCKLEFDVVEEFKNFKKSKSLNQKIIALNRLEEDGDRLYTESMRRLYREENSAVDIIIWSKIFNCFERCYDTCEHVANDIETIALTNS